MTNQEILDTLTAALPGSILRHEEFRNDLTVVVRRDDIVRVAEFVKTRLGFDLVIDVLGVDQYRAAARYEVVYNVYALQHKRYLRLKVTAEEEHPVVPSVTGVWPGAN